MADFSRSRVEGPSVPPRTSILSSSQGVEGSSAALDRAPAPLGRVVLTLQGDQRVDAADGAERGGRLVDFGASLSSTEKPPAAARRGADAFATWAAAFDPVMRMTLTGLGDRHAEASRSTAKGGPVWLIAGK